MYTSTRLFLQISSHENILRERLTTERRETHLLDWLEFFIQIPIFLVNSLIEIPIISVPILLLFTYGLTKKTIQRSHINKQRIVSDFQCNYCGEPILERDVFCKNCQTITPKVQEMLDRNPDKKPDFYCNLDSGYKLRCPHCRTFHRYPRRYYAPNNFGTPIIYCTHCHNYFLDRAYIEWSVAPFFIKCQEFFSIGHLIFYLSFFLIIISSITDGDWLIAHDFTFLLLILLGIHFSFALTRYIVLKRKTFREANMRLQQNPDYPQILINMGYGKMMDKKYHHLSKEIILSRKDKVKELLKDAFTFD